MKSQKIKVAVDAIVLAYKDQQLFVLLIKQKFGVFKNTWSLPGGFVHNGESLSNAVKRELHEEAGITVNYLEQLYTFGDNITRDPRAQVVSVAYFALVNPSKFKLSANTDALDAEWFPITALPKLAFDHKQIIQKAFIRIQSKVQYQPIGFDLLSKEFAFSELENLYKAILQNDLDRRNFRKKIMSFDLLEETGNVRKIGSGRPGKMYRFKKSKYKALEKEGFNFEIKFA